jgi:hypothetical protein
MWLSRWSASLNEVTNNLYSVLFALHLTNCRSKGSTNSWPLCSLNRDITIRIMCKGWNSKIRLTVTYGTDSYFYRNWNWRCLQTFKAGVAVFSLLINTRDVRNAKRIGWDHKDFSLTSLPPCLLSTQIKGIKRIDPRLWCGSGVQAKRLSIDSSKGIITDNRYCDQAAMIWTGCGEVSKKDRFTVMSAIKFKQTIGIIYRNEARRTAGNAQCFMIASLEKLVLLLLWIKQCTGVCT